MSDRPTVLIVDDEESAADVYALRLQDEYETVVAYSGRTALETVDDGVDVVLLDRRMPELSGREILEAIRERGLAVSVIMLTAVDPGLEVIEMPFDDYITKPVAKDELVAAIDRQVGLDRGETRTEYHEIRAKVSLLERELPPDERDGETLERLRERAARLREQLTDAELGSDSGDSADGGADARPDGSAPNQ